MNIERFDSIKTGLTPGITLIEASAGTGKTYAIAMLALRFIVEKDMKVDELLIVTFTNAATEELRERVRLRLAEAKQALEGKSAGVDSNIIDWADSLSIEKADAEKRLETALMDIDQASIFTIHGFCQRVLKEHALESGQLFDSELSSDISAVKQACVDDFWRQQVYGRPIREAALLKSLFDTPDRLSNSIAGVAPKSRIVPSPEDVDAVFEAFNQVASTAKLQLKSHSKTVEKALEDQTFKPGYSKAFDSLLSELSEWLNGESPIPPSPEALYFLTREGIKDGLNGHKFKKKGNQSGDERKEEYLSSLDLKTNPFEKLQERYRAVSVLFRSALADFVDQALEKILKQLNILSFDDLITRLSDVLNQDGGKLLIKELRKSYKAALIDEFQDTDQPQWHIFSSLFAAKTHFLFLIGDPKQAIYKFRGADIYSYFEAQKEASQRYTLEKNWRSHPSLVEAVNILFQTHEDPFLFELLKYNEVSPGLSEQQRALNEKGNALAPLVLWQLDQADSKTGFWTAGKAGLEIQVAVTNEILHLLNETHALISNESGTHPLEPQDIAILVRTNSQAREYQALLWEVGIPSVLNSTESVFATQEAVNLFILLQAVAHPGDIGLLKQTLALSWFKLDGEAMYRLANDEQQLDEWLTRFQDYYRIWNEKGLMTMMLNLLTREQIQVHISRFRAAERQLTNLHHLLELLQQAAVDEHLGVNKTLEWLRSAITEQGAGDEQQLRLESDEQAVKIVTMHRAKGLEFPVVFCPSLWQRSDRLKSEKDLIKCHVDGAMLFDLGSNEFEAHREQALYEELAEDLRLFYVAVTRAKYRCYIAWADVRSEKNPNESAMAELLFEQKAFEFSQQQNILQAYPEKHPQVFEYKLLAAENEIAGRYRSGIPATHLAARSRNRSLETSWQMSSYTALSSLSLKEVPELPRDKVQELELTESPEAIGEQLPKGAHAGNVVHEMLEKTDFSALSRGEDISLIRDQACLRYGLTLKKPEVLDVLLKKTVRTLLSVEDESFCLTNLDGAKCLKEMPFFLSMDALHVSRINAILKDSAAFQPLSDKEMQGYLTGFIDLVCEHRGRYYVMDYKTNSLPEYADENLVHAMREHNYGLQYWIYTLVVHLYLQKRLPDYDYRTHFGGVRYLFVRGMEPEKPLSGVFQDQPDYQRVEALAELFGGRHGS